MSDLTASHEERMKKTINALKEDFNAIRTGRASTALFDKIKVDYYGDKSPLSQVATVSIPEARLVVIQPWDKTLIGEIEKAIQKSELSLNPSNDGKVIRIAIPPLTEDRRKELAKQAKNLAEQSRVSIRNIRRDGNDEFKKMEKESLMTEDDVARAGDELQKLTDAYIQTVNQVLEAKEKEILEG